MTSNQPHHTILISPEILWWIFAFSTLIWIIYLLQELILLLIFSCLIATALYPGVHWLKQKKIPTNLGIILYYLGFVAIAFGICFAMAQALASELPTLIKNIPDYTTRLYQQFSTLPFVPAEQNLSALLNQNMRTIISNAIDFLSSSLHYIGSLFSGLINILTILVFTFFLLSSSDYFQKTFLLVIPNKHKDEALNILCQLIEKIGFYVRGQLFVMLVVGLLFWLGLSIIGIPYAFLIGIIAFFLEIVSVVGPTLTAIIAALVTLATDPGMVIWAVIIYVVIQGLENYVIVPKVMGQATGLHPFWVFLGLLAGGLLMGLPGVILAVPTLLLIKTLLEHYYLKRHTISAVEPSSDLE